ncbi:hypothetical protein SNOG_13167 [Parastagonospora nodorum SN15]|uniref:Uncharacterized protein n=1 Tax=Phaeosphaeria nodorum (strain SN15 / ATCC MYA-4574 / FGSC 10173) TaxID=321614 RepID=Q0U4Z7_PHANO|nr:hypothetical protein SNOG_13167 [Parastagonospora nodorum SN15]EAT79494.2 hypothetical protein SNOG_13167 [Parastagonospora nodorum SN15]
MQTKRTRHRQAMFQSRTPLQRMATKLAPALVPSSLTTYTGPVPRHGESRSSSRATCTHKTWPARASGYGLTATATPTLLKTCSTRTLYSLVSCTWSSAVTSLLCLGSSPVASQCPRTWTRRLALDTGASLVPPMHLERRLWPITSSRTRKASSGLVLTPKQMTFLPVAVSDAVRFIVLHIYGGAYFDMDVLMLRDMRPLLLPKDHAFAERWGAHPHPGEYNTAIMSLSANSSLSSYLLFGGIRMGVNFHPRVLGRMAWKDGRDQEFKMFETAAFDPIWTEFNWDREGRCTVPCLRDYGAVFKGRVGAIKDEWESYSGPQLETIDLKEPQRKELKARAHDEDEPAKHTDKNPHDSFQASLDEETQLRNEGVISDYILDEDKFPPNNRTLSNFFRGSWTYHIHNQVSLESRSPSHVFPRFPTPQKPPALALNGACGVRPAPLLPNQNVSITLTPLAVAQASRTLIVSSCSLRLSPPPFAAVSAQTPVAEKVAVSQGMLDPSELRSSSPQGRATFRGVTICLAPGTPHIIRRDTCRCSHGPLCGGGGVFILSFFQNRNREQVYM